MNVNAHRADAKPCRRCGVPIYWSRAARVPGICRDCRQTDPQYVQAITTGQCIPIDVAS